MPTADPLTLTDLNIHDPSTLIREGDTYYVFGTGGRIPAYASKDLLHWKSCGRVFETLPAWIRTVVPEIRGDGLWAPDIHRVRGSYYLYYAASTFGKNTSAIGLATSPSLAKPRWTDRGLVIASQAGRDDFNAIDPAILATAHDRELYLSLGSFWSGIQLIRLDPATGLPLPSATVPPQRTLIAAHPQDRGNAIEAPFIYEHDGWYYLFANWDLCCRGADSTYNIRLGRSRRVEGPYLDRDGGDMRRGGGTLFLATSDDRSVVGPGHAGILQDQKYGWIFSCHYEFTRPGKGRPTLAVARLIWDKDGWPELRPLA